MARICTYGRGSVCCFWPSGVGCRVGAQGCANHTSQGGAQPTRMRIRMQRPSSPRGAPGSHPQDTVRLRHPRLDRRPQLDGESHAAKDFSSCKPPEGSPLRVTPGGASQRWCRRPAPPSTLGFLYPDAETGTLRTQAPRAGTRPPPWLPATVVAPGSPVNSGSSQVGVHDTTHLARGQKIGKV